MSYESKVAELRASGLLEQLAAENLEFTVFIHERGAREDRERVLGERLDEEGKQIIN